MNEEMKRLIMEYVTEDECDYLSDDGMYNCESCGNSQECHMVSCERCNSKFAESINCCNHDTEEVIWKQSID